MKQITILALALLCTSCQNYLLSELDSRITLDAANTYKVGEPVVFNIDGVPDGITFYSGENGHQYKYRNRAEVPFEDITDLTLSMRIQPRFGAAGAMDILVSKDWKYNLKGNDAASDKAAIKAMIDAGMPGWNTLSWKEGTAKEWTSYQFDLAQYAENFAIAFHWHPTSQQNTISQRTYWIDGNVSIGLKGVAPSTMTLRDLDVITVTMNDEVSDTYRKNKSNGTVVYNGNAAQYNFQGVGATELDYDLDVWVFSHPISLNSVQPDACEVLKCFTSTVKSFEYVYDKPGTYEATFVSFNETVQGRNEDVKKIKITITY